MNDRIDEIMGGFVAGIQALREAEQSPEPLVPPRPVLRLVYSDGSQPHARHDAAGGLDEEAEERMRAYASVIDAASTDPDAFSNALARRRPRLALVPRDGGNELGDIQ